jgi:hypothetical protein
MHFCDVERAASRTFSKAHAPDNHEKSVVALLAAGYKKTRMIEVFKTNVQETAEAKSLITLLLRHFPDTKINFDLDDCDKILRVEGQRFRPDTVILLVRENGFRCAVLES